MAGAAKAQVEAQQSADKDKQLAADAEQKQLDREHDLATLKEKGAQTFELEKLKGQQANEQEVADKIPSFGG